MAKVSHIGTHLFAIALVFFATALGSTAGLFVRLVELDAWRIPRWRRARSRWSPFSAIS